MTDRRSRAQSVGHTGGRIKKDNGMKYHFFSMPALAGEQAQDELNGFLASHRIATVEKMFVPNGDRSFWSVCVTYMDQVSKAPLADKRNIDYREVLDEKTFAVFAKLRVLRKTISEKEGIPAYALFTNEQLAAMVQRRISSLTQLGSIEGVGKACLEKYGNTFLAAMKQEFPAITDTESSGV